MVISKGGPDCTTTNGLRRTFNFVLIDPVNVKRCRTSVNAGPYSPVESPGLAGNVPSPSVLLSARFRTYETDIETSLLSLELTNVINWFWLYRPEDSIRKTGPGLTSERSMCRL